MKKINSLLKKLSSLAQIYNLRLSLNAAYAAVKRINNIQIPKPIGNMSQCRFHNSEKNPHMQQERQ